MIAVFLFLKPYRQTHVYRASRAERGEVIVPGAVIFLVEDILDTYARFQNHGLQIEGVAGIQIPLLEFGSVTVRLRVAFALHPLTLPWRKNAGKTYLRTLQALH